jgi:hypothetical protein
MARSAELRTRHPEIAGALDLYKAQLGELQTALEQVRVMLLARHAHLETGRIQLKAVTQWAAVLQQTQ